MAVSPWLHKPWPNGHLGLIKKKIIKKIVDFFYFFLFFKFILLMKIGNLPFCISVRFKHLPIFIFILFCEKIGTLIGLRIQEKETNEYGHIKG